VEQLVINKTKNIKAERRSTAQHPAREEAIASAPAAPPKLVHTYLPGRWMRWRLGIGGLIASRFWIVSLPGPAPFSTARASLSRSAI